MQALVLGPASAAQPRAGRSVARAGVVGALPPTHRRSTLARGRGSRRAVSCQLQLTTGAPLEVRRPETAAAPLPPQPLPGGLPQALPDLWDRLAEQYGDAAAAVDPHHSPAEERSWRQLAADIAQFASGLQRLGLAKGDKVSLFSENSGRWLVADQGIMKCGAADAVRGISSSVEELAHIMQHSESRALVVQDAATLDKLLPALRGDGAAAPPPVRFVVVLWGQPSQGAAAALGAAVHTYESVLARGAQQEFRPVEVGSDDLATLVYTSGTTGHPKAVMLSHGNLLYQVENLDFFLPVQPGQCTLSLLPPWHVYERAVAYYVYSRGVCQVFSSIRHFRDDLTRHPPDYFICVPLVLDTLHSRVEATLKKASAVRRTLALGLLAAAAAYVRARRVVDGVALQYAVQPRPLLALVQAWLALAALTPLNWLFQRLVAGKVRAALGIRRCVISGGGSLAAHLDTFYESIGLPVLNGWGLTETSPVLACRRSELNVRGSVGLPTPGTEVRVVDPATLRDVPDGQQGLILARGPGVMAGYFNDVSGTAKAFKAGDGFFDTGDLGWRAPAGVAGSRMAGCVVLTGRAKDTIVLSNGENVEPQPLEDLLCASPWIKFAVLVGEDHRALGALIVPNAEALEELAAARGVEALPQDYVAELVGEEIKARLAGRVPWERVAAFEVLSDPFSVDDGTLTRTMKPRRPEILKKYAPEVARLSSRLR